MPRVTERKLKKIEVLLEGKGPDEQGWWAMYCPYHGDSRRSAGLNADDGRFVCHGCNERKTIDEVIADQAEWVIKVPGLKVDGSGKAAPEITEAMIDGWHSALLSNGQRLDALMVSRGLNIRTIEKYELGWDITQAAYTIPIRGLGGEILNVRFYQLDVPEPRRKIWSVTGRGTPVLWPVDQLDYVSLVICEGEMDAMLSIQNGIPAITRTGAADVWNPRWSVLFDKKMVFLCHDMDTKGQGANTKIAKALKRHALRTVILKLPFKKRASHGKDLTDYWLSGRTRQDFVDMASKASQEQAPPEDKEGIKEIFGVNVMRSFDANLVGETLQMKVTVVGKRTPSYVIPSKIDFACDRQASPAKCANCALNFAQGEMTYEINPQDPVVLRLIKVPDDEMTKVIQRHSGIQKCPRYESNITEHRTVEEAYVRASIEDGPSHSEQDFTHRRIISTVSHDLEANQSVVLTGTIRPHPKNQENEFQAWGVAKPATGLDKFEVSAATLEAMQEFKSTDPMAKMLEIAEDQAIHHTKIFNRADLHILTDLVFHSVLELPFENSTDSKGWLDCIVLGDTRTGKSAIAKAIIDLYNAGEMVSCEAATFAGVVGGLDHMSDGSWIVKWGSVPVFDRRAVVLDEVSGLKTGEINSMSDLRSSGVAKLTKIKSEQAMARTRLLWLGNARDGKPLASNTYALDALKRLIGNNEDIARFDIAMCVFSSDVLSSEINKFRSNGKAGRFTTEGYRGILQWAWTRKGTDVRWGSGVQQIVFNAAIKMGKEYIEDPPLVQAANMRMKIARTAAAIAARTYSTTNGKTLLIKAEHVHAAVEFIDRVYSNPGFGYSLMSKQVLRDAADVQKNMINIKDFIVAKPNLIRMIKMSPDVSFMQLKTICGSDDEVRSIMQGMWEMKAATMSATGMTVEASVLKEIREMNGD